jgi:RNA polymerase sigma-70 factor (ECF subfamily)
MLGSLTDVEDALQDTLLAAWRGLPGVAGQSSLRTWLYPHRDQPVPERAARRRPPGPGRAGPAVHPARADSARRDHLAAALPRHLLDGIPDTAPGPEARYAATEAVELAFIAGLQRLPPRPAAALVLRDVLGFDSHQVAGVLSTSPTAVKGTLQRARATVAQHRDQAGHGREPRPGPAAERTLARRFADAYVAADIGAVIALLTDDAWPETGRPGPGPAPGPRTGPLRPSQRRIWQPARPRPYKGGGAGGTGRGAGPQRPAAIGHADTEPGLG